MDKGGDKMNNKIARLVEVYLKEIDYKRRMETIKGIWQEFFGDVEPEVADMKQWTGCIDIGDDALRKTLSSSHVCAVLEVSEDFETNDDTFPNWEIFYNGLATKIIRNKVQREMG